jgi:hypothetical protein
MAMSEKENDVTERRDEMMKALATGLSLAAQAMLTLSVTTRRAAAAMEGAADALRHPDDPAPGQVPPMTPTPTAGPDGPMPSSTPGMPPPYGGSM